MRIQPILICLTITLLFLPAMAQNPSTFAESMAALAVATPAALGQEIPWWYCYYPDSLFGALLLMGGGSSTTVTIKNTGQENAVFRLFTFSEKGELLELLPEYRMIIRAGSLPVHDTPTAMSYNISLRPGDEAVVIYNDSSPKLKKGWLVVEQWYDFFTHMKPTLEGRVSRVFGGRLYESPLVCRENRRVISAQVTLRGGELIDATGLALTNIFFDQESFVRLRALDEEGRLVAEASFLLGARQQISKFVFELFGPDLMEYLAKHGGYKGRIEILSGYPHVLYSTLIKF